MPDDVWSSVPDSTLTQAVAYEAVSPALAEAVLASSSVYTPWAISALLRTGFFAPQSDACAPAKKGLATFDLPLWAVLGIQKNPHVLRNRLLAQLLQTAPTLRDWNDLVTEVQRTAGPPDTATTSLWSLAAGMLHQARVKCHRLDRQTTVAAFKATSVATVFKGHGSSPTPPVDAVAPWFMVEPGVKLAPLYAEAKRLDAQQWLLLLASLKEHVPLAAALNAVAAC